MKMIRSLTPLTACTALVLVASVASAVNTFTFNGRLSASRGRNTNVPAAGNITCGSLTLMSGGTMMTNVANVTRGQNTAPNGPATPALNWKLGADQNCVKHAAGKTIMTPGSIVGGSFDLPVAAFDLPSPPVRAPAAYMAGTDIPVAQVKYFAPIVQIATSVSITAPPAARMLGPLDGGTQCTTVGLNTCANAADFGKFKAGAWASQTGRAAPNFTWCPPATGAKGGAGNPGCNPAAPPGIKAYIKYVAGGNAFGGTMSYVTHQASGVGSIAFFIPGVLVGFNPFGGGEELGTGRGYADYNMISLPAGVRKKKNVATPGTTIMNRYIGPVLGSESVIGMVGADPAGAQAAGKVYTWGFPWTTGTVVQRVTVGGMGATTFTAMGWDCEGTKQGTACGAPGSQAGLPAPAGGKAIARNISLVAGSLSFSQFATGTPAANLASMQILPEPGETLQLFAGVAALLGLAAWRSRRVN